MSLRSSEILCDYAGAAKPGRRVRDCVFQVQQLEAKGEIIDVAVESVIAETGNVRYRRMPVQILTCTVEA